MQFKESKRSILVAVKFDKHAPQLIRWGVDLARRTGMNLELITVTELHPVYFAPYGIDILSDFVIALEGEAMRSAQSQLRKLADDFAGDLRPEIHVLQGYAPKIIMEQGIRSNAALILVGTTAGSHKFIPQGFSTALTLLAEASVPVLVIPSGVGVNLEEKTRNKIIFADDLSSRTESAVALSLNFAARLGQSDFYHVHIEAFTSEVLKPFMMSAASREVGITMDELQTQVTNLLEQKLQTRSKSAIKQLEERGGKYIPVLKSGETRSTLAELVKTLRPTMLIFGRHRTFHLRSFVIGRLPFYSMIEFDVPLMVIPEEQH